LGLACVGEKDNEVLVHEVVRILVEKGGADITLQDDLGDDAVYLSRKSVSIALYLRQQAQVEFNRQVLETPKSMLQWAIHDLQPPSVIQN
jgi:hypothetical protein